MELRSQKKLETKTQQPTNQNDKRNRSARDRGRQRQTEEDRDREEDRERERERERESDIHNHFHTNTQFPRATMPHENWIELNKTADAPSKNYYSLVADKDSVRFTTWLVDPQHGVHRLDARGSVTEKKVTHAEFLDGELHEQIESAFGKEALQQAINTVREKTDAGKTFLTS